MRHRLVLIALGAAAALVACDKEESQPEVSASVLVPPPSGAAAAAPPQPVFAGKVTPDVYRRVLETFYDQIGPDVVKAQSTKYCSRGHHLLTMYRFSPAGSPKMDAILANLNLTQADVEAFVREHGGEARKINGQLQENHPVPQKMWAIRPPAHDKPADECDPLEKRCDRAFERHHHFVMELSEAKESQGMEERIIDNLPEFLRSCEADEPSAEMFDCVLEAKDDAAYAKCAINQERKFGAHGGAPLSAADKALQLQAEEMAHEEQLDQGGHDAHGH